MSQQRRRSEICRLSATGRVPRAAMLAALLCIVASSCGPRQDPPHSETAATPKTTLKQPDNPPLREKNPPPRSNAALEAFNQGQRILAEQKERGAGEAEEKFTLAIERDADYGPAYLQRGMCRRLTGDRAEQALADFLRAAELMPDSGDPVFQAAWTLLGLNRLDEAEEKCAVLAERFPDNAKSRYFLGVIAERRRDLPTALEHFNGALEKEPEDAASLTERACLLAIFAEFDGALDDIARLRRIDPADPRYRYLEGNVYLIRGRWRLDRSFRRDLNDEDRKGLADGSAKDFEQAVTLFTELLRNEEAPLSWGIAHAEAVASRSNAQQQFYAAVAAQFERILEQVEAEIRGEKADALWIFVPRLHRDLAVVGKASGGAEGRTFSHLNEAASFADKMSGLWNCDGVSLIDKWLAYRAVCDAMYTLVAMSVSKSDYAGAQKRLEKLAEFSALINAEHGPAAEDRQREKENIREAICECEFQKLAAPEKAEYSYEECVKFLAHPYYKFRMAGLACLGKGNDPKCKAGITEALDDPDERVVMLAISLAEEKGITAAIPRLAALAGGGGKEVAVSALTCLGELLGNCATAGRDLVLSDGLRAGIPALIEALENGESAVRETAIDALSEVTGRTMLYHHDDAPEARAAAVERWKEWWKKTVSDAAG